MRHQFTTFETYDMQLKAILQQNENMNQIIRLMHFHTPMGRTALLQREMMTCAKAIEQQRLPLDELMEHFTSPQVMATTGQLLSEIRDIHATLESLANGQMVDEIALFEAKSFAITVEKIKAHLLPWPHEIICLPSLEGVVSLLDPDGQRIKSFFIYDGYSAELKQTRKITEALKLDIKTLGNSDKVEELQKELLNQELEAHRLEREILLQLSKALHHFAKELALAFEAMATLDILMAHVSLNKQLNLKRPMVSGNAIAYTGLFHPLVKASLASKNLAYQPISITLRDEVTLLTGANMSGKSILLQSLTLAQLMFQFGFYVPAESATLVPVEEIVLVQGDLQNSQRGLSSFGAEVLQISQILERAQQNHPMLVLLDEPARTTNPVEGEALVDALIGQLQKRPLFALMATHYGSLQTPCRRLKTKGLKIIDSEYITISNINHYIDYSLEEITNGEVPHEAIRIAGLLGGEANWLKEAQDILENRKKQPKI